MSLLNVCVKPLRPRSTCPKIHTPTSSNETIAAWDSLAQVNLMITLEQTFDLTLEVEDFSRLTSIPTILDYLSRHGIQDS